MKTIDQLLAEFKQIPRENMPIELAKYAMKATKSCLDYAKDPEEATTNLGILVCSVFLADDKISEQEFQLLYMSAKISLGDQIDLDTCKVIAQDLLDAKKDLKSAAVEVAIKYLSMWKDEDKEDLLMYLVGLCAIDENIATKEIGWLKILMTAAGAYK